MAQPEIQPDRYRGRKRFSDHSLPDSKMAAKRTKSGAVLQDFYESDQLLLRAAALVLNTSLERLLSLADISRTSSRNMSSEHVETSSNSSSGDRADNYTPPGSSDSENTLNPFPVLLSTQQPARHSGSTEVSNMNGPRHEIYTGAVESTGYSIDPDVMAGIVTGLDPFLAVNSTHLSYPTPPDSNYSQDRISISLDPSVGVSDDTPFDYYWETNFNQSSTSDQQAVEDVGSYGLDHLFDISNDIVRYSEPILSSDNDISRTSSLLVLDQGGFGERRTGQRLVDRTVPIKARRRGPFQRPEQREETGITRKLGACIRCTNRLDCQCILDPENPYGCCKTCIQAAQTRTHYLPCLRYKITDSELLDNAKCPRPTWTIRWQKMEIVDIKHWASDEIKTIKVTQGVGNTSYTLTVREFIPEQGDALARRWVINGIPYSFDCTPYAVANMREAGRVLSDFSENTLDTAIPFWIKGDALLEMTYNMTHIYSVSAERKEDRTLLKTTLRLWAASRMMSRAAHICGAETLGMVPQDFGPTSPSTGKILMPPVFSAQMEIIFVAMILQPTKKEVLSQLKSLVQENQRRSWLAIYLCIFLLLHSCALLTARDNERARLQGAKERFYRPFVIEELHNGAKILLAYFHYCNRGSYPLHMDWTLEDQVALTELKKEQIDFLRETVKLFEEKAPHFRHILKHNLYEDQFYFIAQLYERDWKPRHTV